MRVWDTKTGAPGTDPLPGGNEPVSFSAFSADGSRAASATAGGEVRVWDAGSGQLLVEPIRVSGSVRWLDFDASGRFLTFATVTRDFYVWPLPPSSIGRPVPGWLLKLATEVAGGTMDAKAVLREQASGEQAFDDVRRELAALPDDAPYVEWGRWLLDDRSARSIAPGFTITPADAEKLAQEMAAVPATAPPATVAPAPAPRP